MRTLPIGAAAALLAIGIAGEPLLPLRAFAAIAIVLLTSFAVRRANSVVISIALFLSVMLAATLQHGLLPLPPYFAGVAFALIASLPERNAAHTAQRIVRIVLATIATLILAVFKPAGAVGLTAIVCLAFRSSRSTDVALLYAALTGTSLFLLG